MAVIFEDTLKKEISSGKIAPVYLIFGDDVYLKRRYVDKISSSVCDKDDFFNFQRFGGENELQSVYDAVSQLPLMADRKCVILSDYDFERADKSDFEKLVTLLSDTYDSAVLIVCFDSVEFDYKKSSKAKKLIAAAEKGGGRAVALNHRRAPELAKMLTDGAHKRGCNMDSTAAKYLIESVGTDINLLICELEKLCSFANGADITKTTVDNVSVKSVEASVYNLTKDIFACNLTGALDTLDGLFFMRLEPIIILHTISSSYVDMYRIYAAKKAGKGIPDVISIFGYKGREFVLDRAATALKRFDGKKLSLSFDALIAADRQLKSFNSDARIILEQLIVRLAYIVAKGETVDKA